MAKNFPELTLRGLRAFVVVEETGSVSEAAQQLKGSSSGVSQQISAMEKAIGAKLFDRGSRPLKLTPAGQLLRSHAHKILGTVADAQAALSKHDLVDLPKLTLAIIDDLDSTLTPFLVNSLLERFRDCYVNAYSGRSDYMVEMFQQREADICVSAYVPEDIEGFKFIPIIREPFIMVTAKGLIKEGQSVIDQITEAPFIQYSEAIPIGRAITQHLNRIRFNVPRKFSLEASRSVIAMVGHVNGWAITTPLNLLDAERFIPQIDVAPLPFPAFSRDIYLIARAAEFGDLPELLADECRQLITNQINPRFADFVPHLANSIEIIN